MPRIDSLTRPLRQAQAPSSESGETITVNEAQQLVTGWAARNVNASDADKLNTEIRAAESKMTPEAGQVIRNFIATRLGNSLTAGRGVQLSWTRPTTNVDGTPCTDLIAYRVYYNLDGQAPRVANVRDANAMTVKLTGLAAGTWRFSISAIGANSGEGPRSVTQSVTITP